MEEITAVLNRTISITQNNILIAIAVILALYMLKGFVMIIPIQALYIATGAIFGVFTAIIVNIVGIVICISVSYFTGRRLGADKLEEYIQKHPKLKLLSEFERGNSFFFTYVVRSVGFVPCDIVSFYCGLKRIGYVPHITGSVLGMMPGLVLTVVMGANIRTPGSPRFIISVCFHIFTFIISLSVYNKLKQKNRIGEI